MSPGDGRLFIREVHTVENNQNNNGATFWYENSLSANAAKCGVGITPANDHLRVPSLDIRCKDDRDCATKENAPGGTTHSSLILLWVNVDSEHIERIQRAFIHLIALMQKQYNETHTDTDPFSK